MMKRNLVDPRAQGEGVGGSLVSEGRSRAGGVERAAAGQRSTRGAVTRRQPRAPPQARRHRSCRRAAQDLQELQAPAAAAASF